MIRIFKCKMNENLNINQCVGGKEGELHQSVKLAPLGLVGSNPTSHTNIKGENNMSLNVLVLESVGSCVDNKGNTYPLQTDGTPDTDNGVHFSDCEQEWFDGMSENDYSAFLEWHTDNNLSVYNKESK